MHINMITGTTLLRFALEFDLVQGLAPFTIAELVDLLLAEFHGTMVYGRYMIYRLVYVYIYII